jgi:hypothetical protein
MMVRKSKASKHGGMICGIYAKPEIALENIQFPVLHDLMLQCGMPRGCLAVDPMTCVCSDAVMLGCPDEVSI